MVNRAKQTVVSEENSKTCNKDTFLITKMYTTPAEISNSSGLSTC